MHTPGDDIGIFLAVCDAGRFAGAATRLHLSPSAVAKAIARLEARLGVTLFARSTRRLALTDEGAIYAETCRQARAEIDRTEGMLRAIHSTPAGLLRISLPPLFGAEVIAPALFSLTDDWPLLQLQIDTSTQRSDLIGAGIDFAVRIGAPPPLAGITARRIGTQRVMLCASADYVAARGVPRKLADLGAHRLIAMPQGLPWQFSAQDHVETLLPAGPLHLDGSLLTRAAIMAGHGIGMVPAWLMRDALAARQVVAVLPEALTGDLPIYALWPTQSAILPRLRVVIDAVSAVAKARGFAAT